MTPRPNRQMNEFRRESDLRINELSERTVRVETKMEGLSEQMLNHENNNRSRFTEVFNHIGGIKEQCTRLEATDDHHTAILNKISGNIDILVQEKTAATAIANDRAETIKNIPNLLKWGAGVLVGITGIGGAWAAFKAWLT